MCRVDRRPYTFCYFLSSVSHIAAHYEYNYKNNDGKQLEQFPTQKYIQQ